MNIKRFLKELWVEEKIPTPLTKLVSPYQFHDESPEVSFKQKIYYHSISPQIQVGVTGYARLLDLANIQINSDDEKAKKLIEDWNDVADFKTKLEAMGNTFLICGNAILEKLDDKMTQDVLEVDMTSIIGKKRDEFGKTLYYTQQSELGTIKLGETKLNRYIEFNLNTISRSTWSPCIFESAAIPRKVGNRTTFPLVELVVGLEDAMSTIILNNAYPEVYYTFEGANEEELKKETEKIRKKKPGDRMITTKAPKIELYEAKGQSAYVDYIQYMYKSLSLAVKFPTDILTGDFTSRASSDTTSDLTAKLANAIKRYLANKLKQELYDPILAQNGFNPKDTNLQITFGTQEIIKMTPEIAGKRYVDKIWSLEEIREWDKDNSGVDLFDDDVMNNDVVQQASDLAQQNQNTIPVPQKDGSVVMKPAKVKINKERVKEDFGDTVVYKLEYSHEKIDECDDYADQIYEAGASDMPELPIHPNCKCYFEDEETGEYLGQDPESALDGDIQVPESFKEIKKDIAIIKHKLFSPIDESVTIRAKEIKEKFYVDTVEKAVKDSLKDAVEEVRDIIEEKKFNIKAKNDILKKLNEIMGDNHGT